MLHGQCLFLWAEKLLKRLGNKPLNGRINIVLTSSKFFKKDGIVVVNKFK